MNRIPAFILEVYTALAKALGLTLEELEDEHSDIVHFAAKSKREFLFWIDIHRTDSLNKHSSIHTLYEVIRHEASKTASDEQAKKENVHALLKRNKGPYCSYIKGNVKVHVPVVKDCESGIP